MVNAERGWTESPAQLLRHQVMREMYRGQNECLEIAASLLLGEAEVIDVFTDLITSGLAEAAPRRLGDTVPTDAHLTSAGRAEVRRWDSAGVPAHVKRSCQAAVLSWLAANDGQRLSGTDLFLGNVRAHFYGKPFPEGIVGESMRELVNLGLAEGIATNASVVARPRITPLGHVVSAQFDGDVNAWLSESSRRGDSFYINNSAGVVVANRSPNSQQSVHAGLDAREQIRNVAAAFEQMIDALRLQPADTARAYGLIGQLREAAELTDSEPERARGLLNAAKAVAVNGAGSAAGTALVALIDAVVQGI